MPEIDPLDIGRRVAIEVRRATRKTPAVTIQPYMLSLDSPSDGEGLVADSSKPTGMAWGFPNPLPSYSDATRPSAATVGAGYMIYNTSDGGINVSNGTNWRGPVGGWANT